MVSDKEELKQIQDVLQWYEWTDGCEREGAANEMYKILRKIYNQEKIWLERK